MHQKFPWKEFLVRIAVIAVPVALQNLLATTGSMVDTMMIASLGQTEVGAVGLCAQFSSLMFSGIWGFVGGGMLFFSQYWGAKDDEGINRSYGITLMFMMTVAAVFCLAALFFPELIMRLYTDKESIQAVGVEYLRLVAFAYPLQIYSMAMASLLRSTERVRIPLYGAIVSVAVNLFLNWVLIFGNLGMPRMGVRGAALATSIAQGMNVLTIAVLARLNGHPYVFAVTRHFRFGMRHLRAYMSKCAPILANELLIGVGNMVINIVLGRQPEETIAALAVFRTLEGLVIGFFAGFSNASSILVGKEVGAGNIEISYQRAWRLVYLCQGFIALTCLALVCLHTPILTLMGMTGEAFRVAFGMVLIYGAVAIIRMGNWVQNDTYRAAGDAAFGTILEITFMWLLVVPSVLIAGFVLHLPSLAVFALCYVDEPIRYVLMQVHLYSAKWIKPVTPEGEAGLAAWRARRAQEKEAQA